MGTATGFSLATPYLEQALAGADGLLHVGKTRIAEITDGTSNTIAIGEDAGRDPRYVSPYTEGYYNGDGVTPAPDHRFRPRGRPHSAASLLAVGRAGYVLRSLRAAQQQVQAEL